MWPCGTGRARILERSNYAKAFGAGAPAPRPGALLEVVVTAAKDRRMVHVSADPQAVAAAVAKEWDGLTLGALMPGAQGQVVLRVVLAAVVKEGARQLSGVLYNMWTLA